jgi:single-stranded DNA-binding protein
MIFLNSILIEGTIASDPAFIVTGNHPRCSFAINAGTDAPAIPIVAYGKLARYFADSLPKGRTVRVVGQIRQDIEATVNDRPCLHVAAAHIELRPAGEAA